MTKLPTEDGFEDLVDGYANACFAGSGDEEDYRADILSAYVALVKRIAKHEAYIAKLKESLVIRMSDDVCPECDAVMYDQEPHDSTCSYFGLEWGIFEEATDETES